MSVLKTNSIQPTTPGSEDYFLAKAWVNFNGTGTITIRGDGNVSSLTDYNIGAYGISFSMTMPDANYSLVASSGATVQDPAALTSWDRANNRQTFMCEINSTYSAGGYGYADYPSHNAVVFR